MGIGFIHSTWIKALEIQSSLSRIYKEGEGEYRTAYMLCVTAAHTVHDLCNDIHVWRSLWNILALMRRHWHYYYYGILVCVHVAGLRGGWTRYAHNRSGM